MNWDAIGAVGEIIGATAVFITLLYLATQVRQANSHARAQTRQRMTEQAQAEVYQGMIDEPSIFQSLYKKEPLTEIEWIKLNGWLLAAMRQREYEWFQMRSGAIDEEIWQAYREVIRMHLGTARTRKWWEVVGSPPFDPDFCAMVGQLLDEKGGIPIGEIFQKFLADVDPGAGVIEPVKSD